jgi:hypothetical protein
VTAPLPRLQRPSWSRTTLQHVSNPQPNLQTPALPGEGPSRAQAPSAFITFVRSLDSIHPSSSLPSSPLSDGLGPGKTGRDRARWSRPGPVSDHAPVRKKMRRLAGCCSAVLTRGCSLAVWQSGSLALWHSGTLALWHSSLALWRVEARSLAECAVRYQILDNLLKTMMPGFTSLTSREATMSAGQQLVACMAGDLGEPRLHGTGYIHTFVCIRRCCPGCLLLMILILQAATCFPHPEATPCHYFPSNHILRSAFQDFSRHDAPMHRCSRAPELTSRAPTEQHIGHRLHCPPIIISSIGIAQVRC